MLTSSFPIAQMDIGSAVSDLCEITGFIIIPATFFVWLWVIRKGRRKALAWAAAIPLTLLAILWIAAAIWNFYFQPQISDVQASITVTQLPEVTQYLAADPRRWLKEMDSVSPSGPSDPYYAVEFDLGESDKVWHKFRVELIYGSVSVFDNSRGWLSLDDWRKSATTRQN